MTVRQMLLPRLHGGILGDSWNGYDYVTRAPLSEIGIGNAS
jgi:hypothetical protein